MLAIMSSKVLARYSAATLAAVGGPLLAPSRLTNRERLAAKSWSASKGADLVFSIFWSEGLNGCLSFCIVGKGDAADDNSSSARLAGKENSTSERRAGREALAGRPDCGWSMVECFRC